MQILLEVDYFDNVSEEEMTLKYSQKYVPTPHKTPPILKHGTSLLKKNVCRRSH